MNVFHKVTLQSLRKNKTRTVVTIIGIILSAAMICAVTTFVSSLQNYALEYAVYNDGDWHGAAADSTPETYRAIRDSAEVEKTAYGQILGYAEFESASPTKPYLYVVGGDAAYFYETLPVHLTSGTFPKSTSELLLPSHISTGETEYHIGDTLILALGDRDLDGFLLGQETPCYYTEWDEDELLYVPNEEVLKPRETRTYTVVGFYERISMFEPSDAAGYAALTIADPVLPGDAQLDVFFKMNDPAEVYDFLARMGLDGSSCNTDVLMYSGVSRYDSFSRVLIHLATIVIGLIMFGSISLIYNAFSISVSERTKQFGLLSSIGATKRQLKRMVFFEAFAVSAVGIPLGILTGIGGIGVTLQIIGSKFASMMGDFDAPLRLCVSWQAVATAAVVALVTVLLSAWLPSKRATRVTAVEAIRQTADIKARPAKTSKLTYKLFGLPGVLASKHYQRSRKKYRATVISLFMSIVLFVSAASFTGYLTESVEGGMSKNLYDLYFVDFRQGFENEREELFEILSSEKHVTDKAYAVEGNFSGAVAVDELTEDFTERALALAANFGFGVTDGENVKQLSGYYYFVDDASFRALLAEYDLNEADYFDPASPLSIAVDKNIFFDAQKEKYVTIDTLKGDEAEIVCSVQRKVDGYSYAYPERAADGTLLHCYQSLTDADDILKLTEDEAFDKLTFRVGKTITEAPFYISRSMLVHLNLIYPVSMMEHVLLGGDESLYSEGGALFNYTTYYLRSSDHAATYGNLQTTLSESDFDPSNLFDYAEEAETNRNLITIIRTFAYGFIVLISLIAAANVFNTISTNINLRRREFAMLKSVGMTQRGFRRMMNYECLLYGAKALLYGLPAAAGVTYLFFKAFSDGFETTFKLPWEAIGISVFSVFAVVFATMLYSMRKVNRENPIDALKNENL